MLVGTSNLLRRRVIGLRLLSPFKAALFVASLLSPTTTARALSYSMNFITERDNYGTITMTPKNEADQSALLVICHGLGDTSDGFDDVAEVSQAARVSDPLFSHSALKLTIFLSFLSCLPGSPISLLPIKTALGPQTAVHENYLAHC